jgi:regulatory protein
MQGAEPPRSETQAALRYLARRDRTEAQVAAFLIRRGVSAARASTVVRRLRALGYLNDAAYAQRWAAARLSRKPMGRLRLEAELLAQGVPRALAPAALVEAYGGRSERDLAEALLAQRGSNPGDRAAPVRLRARQARLLRSRGFSEETIEDVIPS